MTGQRQRLQNYIEALLASPADPTAPEEPDGLLPTRADLADLLTDLGNARRFATQHGQDVRYCSGMGWLVWDGKRWARDDGGGVMRRAKATALGLYDEAARALDVAIAAIQQLKTQGDTLGPEGLEEAQARLKAQYQRARKLMAWALQSQSRARLEAMVALAQSEPDLVVHVADLDADPWLFNCANGTLDLRAGELREHRREDYLTMLAGAAYDPAAFGGKWAAHLETFLPDPDVRRQVQRTFGRALVGADLAELLDVWYGGGGNGKTTTHRVIGSVLGEYFQMAAPKLLMASQHERHPTELAELRGRRLIFSAETGQGGKLDEERVKMLTGGERIRAHYMRQDNIEFERTWTIVLVTNHKPDIQGTDDGIWRRIRLIPWAVALPKEEQRPQEEVLSELLEESGAILAWMVEGLRDWRRDPHWTAEAVSTATEDYRQEQDPLALFFADCCVFGPRLEVSAKELRQAYEAWCTDNGVGQMLDNKAWGARMRLQGCTNEQGRRGGIKMKLWRGIGLLSNAPDDDESEGGTDGTDVPVDLESEKTTLHGGLTGSKVPSVPGQETLANGELGEAEAAIGAHVFLVTSNGVIQNSTPWTIRDIKLGPDGEQYAFFHETSTGWPLAACVVAQVEAGVDSSPCEAGVE